MKQSLKLGLLGLIATTSIQAANPIEGWYAGLALGASSIDKLKMDVVRIPNGSKLDQQPGIIKHKLFGNIAGQIGYRFFDNFRTEAELMALSNDYHKLHSGTISISSTKKRNGLHLKGKTNVGAILINSYLDLLPGQSDFSPYLGLGVGYAHITDNIRLYQNNSYVAGTRLKYSTNQPVAQAIIGANYFLDDFTWVGIDYRYLATKAIPYLSSRLQANSVNLSISGSFGA